jgi:WD40-like Beta Propeller Repeat
VVLVACATLACPQLMEDDFGVSDGGSGPAGGASALGGAGVGAGGAGGDDGGGGTGSRPSGGAAGVSNGGTSGSVCSDTQFSTPTLVSELDLDGNLWGPSLSSDGLTLYFAVESDSDPGDLYRAVRRDRSSAFAAPTPIAELNTAGAEGTPYATVYGIFFFSDRQGGPDIWRAVRALDGSFPAPELVPAVNSTEATQRPVAHLARRARLPVIALEGAGVVREAPGCAPEPAATWGGAALLVLSDAGPRTLD